MLPFVGNNRHHFLVKASLSLGQMKKKDCVLRQELVHRIDKYRQSRMHKAIIGSDLADETEQSSGALLGENRRQKINQQSG
jgi:hypothetical protein